MERILKIASLSLVAFIVECALSAEIPEGSVDATAKVMERTFQWFDTLDYPSFRNRRFVSVTLQGNIKSADDPTGPPKIFTYGFLLGEDECRFKVLKLDLGEEVFEKPTDGVARRLPATHEVADFVRVAEERLKELCDAGDSFDEFMNDAGGYILPRTQLFVLARACQAQGYPHLARQAMEHSITMPDYRTGNPLGIDHFQESVADDIGNAETWRSFVAFGNPEVSRVELLRRFRRIARHFPNCRHAKRVNNTIAILTRMVKEDREHAAKKLPQLDEMPVEQRVAELIFQLRDQNGRQYFQPGSCNIFSDPRDSGLFGTEDDRRAGSPAAQLVAIGRPALGQLIDSVDDDEFTRCVQYHRSFYFSHHVIRVGQCCREIMNRINPTGRVWDSEKDREKAKREMKTWYLGKAEKK